MHRLRGLGEVPAFRNGRGPIYKVGTTVPGQSPFTGLCVRVTVTWEKGGTPSTSQVWPAAFFSAVGSGVGSSSFCPRWPAGHRAADVGSAGASVPSGVTPGSERGQPWASCPYGAARPEPPRVTEPPPAGQGPPPSLDHPRRPTRPEARGTAPGPGGVWARSVERVERGGHGRPVDRYRQGRRGDVRLCACVRELSLCNRSQVAPESPVQLRQGFVVQGGLMHLSASWCCQVAVALASPRGLSPLRRRAQTQGGGSYRPAWWEEPQRLVAVFNRPPDSRFSFLQRW